MKTLLLSCATFLFAVLLSNESRAATVITSGTDAELRAAVANCGTVTFNFDGVITLTNPIVVSCAVTLDATGHAVILSGGGSKRLFQVQPGASLQLLHLTVADGRVQGTNGSDGSTSGGPFGTPGQPGQSAEAGGILVSNATFFAADCTFSNCVAVGGTGGSAPPGTFLVPRGAAGNASGGFMMAYGSSVALSNCVLVRNSAVAGLSGSGQFLNRPEPDVGSGVGGALACIQGDLTVADCRFITNAATISGGALHNNGASVRLFRNTFDSNSAGPPPYFSSAAGGAIAQAAGTLEVADCQFQFNSAMGSAGYNVNVGLSGQPARGGGVSISGGTSVVQRSTFKSNKAIGGANGPASSFGAVSDSGEGFGGALYSQANVVITNSTFAFNLAAPGAIIFPHPDSSAGRGGALAISSGTLGVFFSTIASNAANSGASHASNGYGGGSYVSGGTLTMGNTILSGNTVNGLPTNFFGAVTDAGHNISSDATPTWTSGTSLNNTDPLLLPLADYGGPTLTMALRVSSAALNNADCASAPPIDQRGFPRPNGPGCDVGAYEGAGIPRLEIIRENSSTNKLRWLAEASRIYRLDESASLSGWTPLATNTATSNGWFELRIPANASPRFFQLNVQ